MKKRKVFSFVTFSYLICYVKKMKVIQGLKRQKKFLSCLSLCQSLNRFHFFFPFPHFVRMKGGRACPSKQNEERKEKVKVTPSLEGSNQKTQGTDRVPGPCVKSTSGVQEEDCLLAQCSTLCASLPFLSCSSARQKVPSCTVYTVCFSSLWPSHMFAYSENSMQECRSLKHPECLPHPEIIDCLKQTERESSCDCFFSLGQPAVLLDCLPQLQTE